MLNSKFIFFPSVCINKKNYILSVHISFELLIMSEVAGVSY